MLLLDCRVAALLAVTKRSEQMAVDISPKRHSMTARNLVPAGGMWSCAADSA